MPHWLGPLLALCALVGFIGFAFRQGTKVKPNKDHSDAWTGGVERTTARMDRTTAPTVISEQAMDLKA